jgi:hypothetical protein
MNLFVALLHSVSPYEAYETPVPKEPFYKRHWGSRYYTRKSQVHTISPGTRDARNNVHRRPSIAPSFSWLKPCADRAQAVSGVSRFRN